jgi:hypothetical protein
MRLLVPAGHRPAGRPSVSLVEVAGDRWIHGSALVGAGVGVALVPSLALTGSPQVRDSRSPPAPRYIGVWLPQRHQPNPAAERLLAALRVHAPATPETQTGHR